MWESDFNNYLTAEERKYYIDKENRQQNEVPAEVTEVIDNSAQRGTTPTDD